MARSFPAFGITPRHQAVISDHELHRLGIRNIEKASFRSVRLDEGRERIAGKHPYPVNCGVACGTRHSSCEGVSALRPCVRAFRIERLFADVWRLVLLLLAASGRWLSGFAFLIDVLSHGSFPKAMSPLPSERYRSPIAVSSQPSERS